MPQSPRRPFALGEARMHGSSWVIFDTETTGLTDPIHAVEIAAQRMHGWERTGPPFRILLNHDVEIEPSALKAHGYTRDYLRAHGSDPREAHRQFRDYVGDAPLVAHNLNYDWDRVLSPEWQRLGLPPAGRRGFCSLWLSRRIVTETPRHSLATIIAHFFPGQVVRHHALPDVLQLADLFEKIFRARLIAAGLDTLPAIAAFAEESPAARTLEIVLNKAAAATSAPANPPPAEAPGIPIPEQDTKR